VDAVPDRSIALFESHAAVIVRLRYSKATRLWSLYWRDRNLKFHEYDRVPASASVDELLAEVDRDPTAIFWG
jgi:hypothetical protein